MLHTLCPTVALLSRYAQINTSQEKQLSKQLRTYIPTARHWHASAKTPIKRVLHLAHARPYPTSRPPDNAFYTPLITHITTNSYIPRTHATRNSPIPPSPQRPSFFSLPSQPKHTHFTTQTPPAHMPPMPYQSHPPPNVTSLSRWLILLLFVSSGNIS